MKTHLFGEMDLNLQMPKKAIIKEAGRIAQACGYAGEVEGGILIICSSDFDIAKIEFHDNKVVKVTRSFDDGNTWEELNFKEKLFSVSPEVLKKYNAQIKYGIAEKLPMSQGMLLNAVVKKYKIQGIKKWGWHYDLIGIETVVQFLIWRDCGSHAEFLGGINKDGSAFQ